LFVKSVILKDLKKSMATIIVVVMNREYMARSSWNLCTE